MIKMSHIAGLWRLAAGYLFGTFDYTNLNLTEILPKIVIQLIMAYLAGGQLDYTNLVFKLNFLTPFKPGLRWLRKLA